MPTLVERTARTRIRVTAGTDGSRARARTAVTLSDPTASGLRPMLVDHDAAGARMSLVPDGALLLAGDRVEIDIEVGAGVRLDLVEPGGTVAFPMHGASASWDVRVDVAAGGTLTWAGEPFVVSAGARVRRTTRVRCAAGGRVALRESLVLGRYAEAAGSVHQSTVVVDDAGRPVLVEDLDLDQDSVPALLGGARVVSTVLALGVDVDGPACPERFDLDAPGAVQWRSLDLEAHRSRTAAGWQVALAALAVRGEPQ
ncbi:MAG TPA: urease accessory protein UreD [Nocardioides sp.]|nr:urease accessory protein UreD [Nocardioides sp.]